ncbi:MAG: hypothetical protein Q9224_004163, partial [Gallowayella concinna]
MSTVPKATRLCRHQGPLRPNHLSQPPLFPRQESLPRCRWHQLAPPSSKYEMVIRF